MSLALRKDRRAVAERAAGAKVNVLRLEIGKLSAVMPDAIRFCFDLCAQGTALDGAQLEIIEIPGRGRCRECGEELAMADFLARCACGSITWSPSGASN